MGFDSTLASTESLEVDVVHLNNIGTYLTTVADAITAIRDGALHQAHRSAMVGGEPEGGAATGGTGRSALGSPAILEVADLAGRENGTFTAVDNSLKTIAEDLRNVADGVADIAENYRTVEERNAVTAAEWTQAISS